MTPLRTIDVVVDAKGNVTVQTRGFAGPACQEASRFLEEALGRRGTERLTAEYFRRAETDQQLRQSE